MAANLITLNENNQQQHEVLQKAQLGDMIQFQRKHYSHWSIYVGDHKVIHRWGDDDGIGNSQGFRNLFTFSGVNFNKARIEITDFMEVLKDGTAKINNYLDHKYKPLPTKAIIDRARRALRSEGYNLIYDNCEHFATDCRYGQPNSRQVQVAVSFGAAAAALLTGTALAVGMYLGTKNNESDEEKNEKQMKLLKT
ncbi:unnamed protein product [Didymodactylos carnosus]|uniref:LRAT domain-containing protein n=1 Tax=Didymodactylos carnosus TaxID=1234261 RepID=A0A814B9T5_9BILA|nr:unnamed protein product [Didymodactylos carnosus]CAF1376261.1 unnamed protein product [Didymodactylos carnosus]CAF3704244.1 unnamed protein product [Didymodactylos carnosus]CAF4184982.1 unnamed protein product [Didymodactylos carnosus]